MRLRLRRSEQDFNQLIMEKKLYPFKFVPVASRRPWGGSALVKELGKQFVECDEEGNETTLGEDVLIGESWELADMGIEDSVVANGWLAGNTIGDMMETYLERIVGENVYNFYGRQFPLLIKFLDINDKLSVQVHPDDEVAAERYDSLGKAEIWYVMDAKPGAKMYCGFNREMTAQEFYDRCHNGTVDEVLNVIEPKKGDVIFITPGTVHAADGGLLIAEIQESSDMTFRLYDWGREFNPETARQTHLEEAIDLIDTVRSTSDCIARDRSGARRRHMFHARHMSAAAATSATAARKAMSATAMRKDTSVIAMRRARRVE